MLVQTRKGGFIAIQCEVTLHHQLQHGALQLMSGRLLISDPNSRAAVLRTREAETNPFSGSLTSKFLA